MSYPQTYFSGIQQIGIGVPDVHEAWAWYRKHFGMDVPVFEEAATANLMLPYTGGEPQDRHAILAINMQGGGGFEIWQYTSRTPQPPAFDIKLGDLGFYACKMKCRNVEKAFKEFDLNYRVSDKIHTAPNGARHFFVKDLYGNLFQIVECDNVFMRTRSNIGGVYGVIMGVSDIFKSSMYFDALMNYRFDEAKLEQSRGKIYDDFQDLPNGDRAFKRVIMETQVNRVGAFAELLGPSEIELVQLMDGGQRKIYEDRFWGDLGFIHLCYDTMNLNNFSAECIQGGFPFTVDSNSTFDMGEAAGRFAYIEDPDGALLEFVETAKVPIMKKWGWYLDLMKRKDFRKPLPRWMLRALSLNRKR